MRGVNLFETSIAVGLARKFDTACKNSWINSSLDKLLSQIKVCFRGSFLGRITEIGGKGHPEILDNSKVARWVLNTYNIWRDRLVDWTNSSLMINSAIEARKELYFFPLKTGGVVVVVAASISMILFSLMSKKISGFGWSMWGVFLIVGFCGMFCNVEWEELKGTSGFIKWIEKGGHGASEHQDIRA